MDRSIHHKFLKIHVTSSMPCYAILGATGKTGSSVLQILSKDPAVEIHALVRSKAKLMQQDPSLEAHPGTKIFEGSLDNTEVLTACITGTDAIFQTIAVTDNVPNCTIATDTARSLVLAFQRLRDSDKTVRLPRLVVLSSQSTEEYLCRDTPWLLHLVATTAFSNIYQDLHTAEAYLRSQSDWLSVTFIKPGGLSRDVQRGHRLSTEQGCEIFVSFLDLAAGMIEVAATEGDKWDMKSVCVLPKHDGAKFDWMSPVWLCKGLLCHFFPALYPWMKS